MADIPVIVIDPAQAIGHGEIGPFPFEQCTLAMLAQGDSWFSIGAFPPTLTTNLLAELRLGRSAVVVNCARPGHVLQHMASTTSDRQFLSLLSGPLSRRWNAVLVSGGGNDLIDAVGVPPSAPARLRLLATPTERGPAANGPAAYLSDAGWATFSDHLAQVFDLLLAARRRGQNKNTPLLFHTYAALTPRPAGAGLGFGPWLQPWLAAYEVPVEQWQPIAALLIDRLAELLGRLVEQAMQADPNAALTLVDTRPAGLALSDLGATGESGDFVNEIHPTRGGYAKLGGPWRLALDAMA